MDVRHDWPRLRLQTVERVLTLRWVGVVGLGIVGAVVVGIAANATRTRTLDFLSCTGGLQSCEPTVVPPSPDANVLLVVTILFFVLMLAVAVVTVFGPASRAAVTADGQLVPAGGLLPQKPADIRTIERLTVGAVALRGLLIIYCGDRLPIVMLAPVDGITRLVDEARQRGVVIPLDGL